MEFVGELDLDPRPAGADATETEPRSFPGMDSEVMSLMLEALAVVTVGMLSAIRSARFSCLVVAWLLGTARALMF